MATASQRVVYRKTGKKSLCRKKTRKPCRKVKGCKWASGEKRSYCRKKRSKRVTQRR